MDFSDLSPAERYTALGQSIEAENAIAAYQMRQGIPSTVDTPAWMRPPPADAPAVNILPTPPTPPNPDAEPPPLGEINSERSQALQKIVRDTQRRDFEARLAEQRRNQFASMDRYAEEIQRPGYDTDRAYAELNRQRQNTLDQIREANARRNPTPPQTPPTTDRRPPPTSLDNSPSLRTPQTSGARAPVTATAPPRPAQPSHWNLYQPPGATPPPATRAIPRTMDAPPPSLPQAAARGRLAYGGAGAGLDLGLRLAGGQDLGQAAYGAAGGLAGGLAGQGLGQAIGAGLGAALGGPPGAAVGGMLGGFIGGFGGAAAGGSLADRYYPGNNAPLPGTFPLGQQESVPLPRPIAPRIGTPGPAIPFDPRRPTDRRPRLGNLPDPSDPVSDFGPYYIEWRFQTGGEAQRQNPLQIPAGAELHGPISFSQRYDAARSSWIVLVTSFGNTAGNRRNTPVVQGFEQTGWPDRPPRNFTSQNLSLPNSPPQPFNPANAWPPTPETAPRPNPNNSPNEQYHPNPLPQVTPSPTGQPTGEPLPGNLGGNEPELQPQRSPDNARPPSPGDRAYPPGASSGGNPGAGNSGFPTIPLAPLLAASALPAQRRARITTSAARPTPTTTPRGSGPATPPPPPSTPEEPCRGNRCSQRQLQGIDDANLRLLRLEQGLLGGADAGANAAILRKLNEIDAKLGPQIANGGIGNFLKRLWDNLGISKILNVLTFITTLHNAKMLSQDIAETLLVAFDQALSLTRFDDFLKTSEGERTSLSEWVGDQVESFAKTVLGDDTVEEIKVKWQRLNRIYQAAQNMLFAFQSILFSVQEALEVIGQWVARIGNALKKYGVVFEKAYQWMNPNPDFSSKLFTRLDRAEELANALATVTGSIKEVEDSVEYFSTARQELKTQLETGVDNPEQTSPENTPKKEAETQAKTDSTPPEIEETELNPPEEDNGTT